MNKKLLLIALISMSSFMAGCTKQKVAEVSNQPVSIIQTKTDNAAKSIALNSSTSNSTGTEKQPQEIFYGQWVIEKPLAYGKVGTYGSDNIAQLIGRKLSFSKEKATCFGDTIKVLDNVIISPVYKKIVISKVDFETANPAITFDKLGIKADSITQIETTDSKGNGCTLFIKNNDTLIVSGGMTFFQLVR